MRPRLLWMLLSGLAGAWLSNPRAAGVARAVEGDTKQVRLPSYRIAAVGQLMRRTYGYYGESSGALREYSLDRAPALALKLGFYPVRESTRDVAVNLGLTASYQRLLSATSSVDGVNLGTQSQSWQVGILTTTSLMHWLELSFGLNYGEQAFTVEDTYVPDPLYRFAGPELGLRLSVWRLFLQARFGTRLLLHTGELQSPVWFPMLRGVGTELELGLGARLVGPVALVVGGTWIRYTLELNAEPGTAGGDAAGAIDLYLVAWSGLEARF